MESPDTGTAREPAEGSGSAATHLRHKEFEDGSGWQPIETAPKHGARFLAYEEGDEAQFYVCWWQEDFTIRLGERLG
jgi:hypothetical protein